MRIYLPLIILTVLLFSINHFSQQLPHNYFQENIEVYFSFDAPSNETIRELTNIISIDDIKGMTVYAYANEKEYAEFLSFNLKHTILPKPGELIIPEMSDDPDEINDWNVYPTYSAYVNMMMQFAIDYPNICQFINAGTTLQGRSILFVKISDNVSVREPEPQFMYTSTIHGDETTGYVLMLRLIDSLLTSYGTDARITNIINNSEIWINPNANPDGTYNGGNGSVYGAIRYNSNGYDLNRNFPDPEYGVHSNQQQETSFFRAIAEQNNFVLCANFHGGTEVVNYPWDTWTNGYPDYASHADENWYEFISHLYADTCQTYSPSNYMNGYDDGITNGGTWYVIHGGRQDYMNWFMKSREVTIEISDTKLLPAYQLPAHWEYNKRSFLNYLKSIFYGVRGIVTDTAGNPLNANIKVLNHDTLHSEIRTDSLHGNYYRMLAAGTYSLQFTADGHYPQTINNVVVNNFQSTILDVELTPEFVQSTFPLTVTVANGWNLVSTPGINPAGMEVTTWWPNQAGSVFGFNGVQYVVVTEATPGEGYWMNNTVDETYNYTAIETVPNDPIPGLEGWNMIGGYENSVPVTGLTTTPSGQIIGIVFGFNGVQYVAATNLEPGNAYWINLLSDCEINIPTTLAKGRGEEVELFKADWGRIHMTDAAGISTTLYAVKGVVNLDIYELPPLPPAGSFDIRFSSGRIAEEINSSVQTIDMTGVTYPITVKVEGMDIRLQDESSNLFDEYVKNGEELVISDAQISKIIVAGEIRRKVYSLEQNYPNPFNPSTTIRCEIPEQSFVTIKVYNILGKEIATLVNEVKPAGSFEVEFNSYSGMSGIKDLPSGIYFYKLQAGNFVETKKMILMK
jgi:hypothetical protein